MPSIPLHSPYQYLTDVEQSPSKGSKASVGKRGWRSKAFPHTPTMALKVKSRQKCLAFPKVLEGITAIENDIEISTSAECWWFLLPSSRLKFKKNSKEWSWWWFGRMVLSVNYLHCDYLTKCHIVFEHEMWHIMRCIQRAWRQRLNQLRGDNHSAFLETTYNSDNNSFTTREAVYRKESRCTLIIPISSRWNVTGSTH